MHTKNSSKSRGSSTVSTRRSPRISSPTPPQAVPKTRQNSTTPVINIETGQSQVQNSKTQATPVQGKSSEREDQFSQIKTSTLKTSRHSVSENKLNLHGQGKDIKSDIKSVHCKKTPDSVRQRELKKLEDYWTTHSPIILEDSPRLRRSRRADTHSPVVPEHKTIKTNGIDNTESNQATQLHEGDSLPESPVPKRPQRTNKRRRDSDHSYSVCQGHDETYDVTVSCDAKHGENCKENPTKCNTTKNKSSKYSSPTNIFVKFGAENNKINDNHESSHRSSVTASPIINDKVITLRRSSRLSPALTITNTTSRNVIQRLDTSSELPVTNLESQTTKQDGNTSISILCIDSEKELSDSSDSHSSDDDYIPPRKKLRSEITNDELWDGIPTVSFKRLAPICKIRLNTEINIGNEHERSYSGRNASNEMANPQTKQNERNCEAEENQYIDEDKLLSLSEKQSSSTIDTDTEIELLKETPSQINVVSESNLLSTSTTNKAVAVTSESETSTSTCNHHSKGNPVTPVNKTEKHDLFVPKRSARLLQKSGFASPVVGNDMASDNNSPQPLINKYNSDENNGLTSESDCYNLTKASVSHILACTDTDDAIPDKTASEFNDGSKVTNNIERNQAITDPKESLSDTLQRIFNSVHKGDHNKISKTKTKQPTQHSNKKKTEQKCITSTYGVELEDPLVDEPLSWIKTTNQTPSDNNSDCVATTSKTLDSDSNESPDPSQKRTSLKKKKYQSILVSSKNNKSRISTTKKVPPLRIRLKHSSEIKAVRDYAKYNLKDVSDKMSNNIKKKVTHKCSKLSNLQKDTIKKKVKKNSPPKQDASHKKTKKSQTGQNTQKKGKTKCNKKTSSKKKRSLPSGPAHLRMNTERRLSIAETLLANPVLNKHACVIWSSENRRHQQLSNPDATHGEIDDILRQKWQSMADTEKIRYFQRAQFASRDENKHSNRKNGEISAVKKETQKPEQNPSIERFLAMDSQTQLSELKKWLHFYHEVSPEEYLNVMNSFKECLNEEREEREREKEREKEMSKAKSKKKKRVKKELKVKSPAKEDDCHARYRRMLFEKIFEVKDKVICIWNDKKDIQREMLRENFSGMTKKLISGQKVPFSTHVKSDRLTEVLTDIKGLEADRKISVIGNDSEAISCLELLQRLQDASPMKSKFQTWSPPVDIDSCLEQMKHIELPPLSPRCVENILQDVSGLDESGPYFPETARLTSPDAMLTDWVIEDMIKTHPNLAIQGTVVFQDKDKITTGVFNSKKELCFPRCTRSGRHETRGAQNSMKSLLNSNQNNNASYSATKPHYSQSVHSTGVVSSSASTVLSQAGHNLTNMKIGELSRLQYTSAKLSGGYVQYPLNLKAYTNVLTPRVSDIKDVSRKDSVSSPCNYVMTTVNHFNTK